MTGGFRIVITLVAWTFATLALLVVGYLGWKEIQSRLRRRRHHRHREH